MRTVGSNGDATEKAIRSAAIDIIAKHGFKAASLRLIANEVGIQAGSLYNYITSKEEFLYELMRENLGGMIEAYQRRAGDLADPQRRLEVFIDLHLDFHIDSQKEVFIGNMELRNLSPGHYEIITGLRDKYSGILTGIIRDGIKTGVFATADARVASFAVLALLSGVCSWYRPNGRLSRQKLKQIHADLAFRALGASRQAAVAKSGRLKKVGGDAASAA